MLTCESLSAIEVIVDVDSKWLNTITNDLKCFNSCSIDSTIQY